MPKRMTTTDLREQTTCIKDGAVRYYERADAGSAVSRASRY